MANTSKKICLTLEKQLEGVIIGQDDAIKTVASAIWRQDHGWFDDDHPLVFLFLGPSGTGKTELAKQVAKYLFKDDKKGFIRMDMSEYQERYSVSRLIGPPPGYRGHEEGGHLTKALQECADAVVLFDEVEKAHPDVLTVLLQLFDEGRLTDGLGKTVNCKRAIYIMTSNLASEAIVEHVKRLECLDSLLDVDGEDTNSPKNITLCRQFKDTVVRPLLKRYFERDEFMGRISETVYFLPFNVAKLRKLATKELDLWACKAKKNCSLNISWDAGVIDLIIKQSKSHYGARSIKHEVENIIIGQLCEILRTNEPAKAAHISVKNQKDDNCVDAIKVEIS